MSSAPFYTATSGSDGDGTESVQGNHSQLDADAAAVGGEIRRPTHVQTKEPPSALPKPPTISAVQLVVLALLSPLLVVLLLLYAVCASPFILSGYCAGQPSSSLRQPALSEADRSTRHAKYIRNSRGLWLYIRAWLPSSKVRGVVFVMHGLGEHISRPGYEELAQRLVAAGYAVHAMDNAGHGRSTGVRSYTERWHCFVDDQLLFIHSLDSQYHSSTPRFIFAHSLGGLIGLHVVAALTNRPPSSTSWQLAGCVVSAPAAQVDPAIATPLNIFLARLLSFLAPKVRIDSIDPVVLSRNVEAVQRYISDPLVDKGGLRARFGYEILRAQRQLEAEEGEGAVRLSSIRVPILLLHGAADVVCSLGGSRFVLARIGSADKRLIVYDGRYHEMFEDESDAFFQDIVQFVQSHTSPSN